MHINKYEMYWIYIIVAVLGVFLAALMAGAVIFGVRLPTEGAFVNPSRLDETEFANPGLREMGDGRYEVYMTAQMWSFTPNEIRVPVGSEVTFNVTSRDITHGLLVEHHNVNIQIVPGLIGQLTVTLDRPGEYALLCHEYCGRGHHLMHGTLIVEDVETVSN